MNNPTHVAEHLPISSPTPVASVSGGPAGSGAPCEYAGSRVRACKRT